MSKNGEKGSIRAEVLIKKQQDKNKLGNKRIFLQQRQCSSSSSSDHQSLQLLIETAQCLILVLSALGCKSFILPDFVLTGVLARCYVQHWQHFFLFKSQLFESDFWPSNVRQLWVWRRPWTLYRLLVLKVSQLLLEKERKNRALHLIILPFVRMGIHLPNWTLTFRWVVWHSFKRAHMKGLIF